VELQKLDTAHQEERNGLIEENNQLKNLYRQNMQLAKNKIEEMEAEFEESKRLEKEKWRVCYCLLCYFGAFGLLQS
jgi:hypothetical protein